MKLEILFVKGKLSFRVKGKTVPTLGSFVIIHPEDSSDLPMEGRVTHLIFNYGKVGGEVPDVSVNIE
jgi:hypothetical protein